MSDGTERSISNLELVHWVECDDSMHGRALTEGGKVEKCYESFEELYNAILEHGTLVISKPLVDLILLAIDGEFDGHLMAIRQSGRNVRRFLVRRDFFDEVYGSVLECFDHLLSNNAIDSELEIKHLYDLAETLKLSTVVEKGRDYGRLETDLVAALQHLDLMDTHFGNDEDCVHAFDLGYCVGRLFSSAQNWATLEPDARKASMYEQSYRERGKKGKSDTRKQQRLDQLFYLVSQLVKDNPAFSRLSPKEVAKLALLDAEKDNPQLWTQGKGQIDQYLVTFASDEKYRAAYRNMFPETG